MQAPPRQVSWHVLSSPPRAIPGCEGSSPGISCEKGPSRVTSAATSPIRDNSAHARTTRRRVRARWPTHGFRCGAPTPSSSAWWARSFQSWKAKCPTCHSAKIGVNRTRPEIEEGYAVEAWPWPSRAERTSCPRSINVCCSVRDAAQTSSRKFTKPCGRRPGHARVRPPASDERTTDRPECPQRRGRSVPRGWSRRYPRVPSRRRPRLAAAVLAPGIPASGARQRGAAPRSNRVNARENVGRRPSSARALPRGSRARALAAVPAAARRPLAASS